MKKTQTLFSEKSQPESPKAVIDWDWWERCNQEYQRVKSLHPDWSEYEIAEEMDEVD